MLRGDDGQAWREAGAALPKISAALPSGVIITDPAAICAAFECDEDRPHAGC